jgi:hypothetical protein
VVCLEKLAQSCWDGHLYLKQGGSKCHIHTHWPMIHYCAILLNAGPLCGGLTLDCKSMSCVSMPLSVKSGRNNILCFLHTIAE